jgi:hypothetical protein
MIHLSLATAAGDGKLVDSIVLVAVIASAIAAYWIPTAVAVARHASELGTVAVINAFLGWTAVGWIIALARAVRSPVRPTRTVIGPGR